MGQKERVLSLEHEGRVYNLTARDFTAEDELEIYRATGGATTLLAQFTGGATLFGIAALVWRYRVNQGEDVSYLDVARTFTFDTIETVEDGARESDAPEA